MAIENVIIVKQETRVEKLKKRMNSVSQAKFYIEQAGGSYDVYEKEHDAYQSSFENTQKRIRDVIKNKVIDKSFLPNYLFSENDLVVVVGQDGLVANTAKYVHGIPIIGVNPDPERYDGVLLPFIEAEMEKVIEQVISGRYKSKEVTMAEAKLKDGQRLLAFNDIFIGPNSHTSARYQISLGKESESHSSSGIIVSTGAGSTGWLSSLFNMAQGISNQFGMQNAVQPQTLPWDSPELVFVVREPFVSKTSSAKICAGRIGLSDPLIIESRMPNYGVIFSDGIESDFLSFHSGAIAQIGIAPEKAILVVK